MPNSPPAFLATHPKSQPSHFPTKVVSGFLLSFQFSPPRQRNTNFRMSGKFSPEGRNHCLHQFLLDSCFFLSGKSYKKSKREQHEKKTRLKHPPRKSNRRGWEFYDRKGFSGPEHFPRFGLVALNLLFFFAFPDLVRLGSWAIEAMQ